jgi:predicted negative regulator of RcsB-dependent stress response
MAVYDLEEQEQLDDLKAWWSRWGNLVSGAVIAVCVAVVAVQGWRWWQHNQAEQASALYAAVAAAARADNLPKGKDAMAQLADRYAGTGYAPRAAMLMTGLLFKSGDKAGAKSQLQFVVDRSDEDELKQIARFRLAEVLFDEQQFDDALRTLDARHDEPFAGVYADLRGDILAAASRKDDARTAYQLALTKLDPKSPYRAYVQVKLDALGGTVNTEGAAAAAGTAASAAPSPAAGANAK